MKRKSLVILCCLALFAALGSTAFAVGHNAAVRRAAKTVDAVSTSVPIPASGTTSTTLFSAAGLTVVHGCLPNEDQSLTASTSKVGIVKLIATDDDGLNSVAYEDWDFTPADGSQTLVSGGATENMVGHLIWETASGKVLTFDFQMETNAFGGPDDCTIGGTLIAG